MMDSKSPLDVSPSEGIHIYPGPRGLLVCDERYFPALLVTWIGASSVDQIDTFFAWHARALGRAIESNQVFALITDASEASRPDARVRSRLAEATAQMHRDLHAADPLRAANFVVISSPLIRGALTAVGWIIGVMDHEYSPSLADAFSRSRREFAMRGATWPHALDAATYLEERKELLARARAG